MDALVFTVRADGEAFASRVDGAHGYPRTPTDADLRGGGRHVPHAEARTLRHNNLEQHPTLALWAYPADGVARAVMAGVELAAIVPLDASWTTLP